jgi:hypothetical protein
MLLAGTTARAENWQPVLECDGAHVDVNADLRIYLQLVVDRPDALQFFSDHAIAYLTFGAREYVMRGDDTKAMDFGASTGPKLRNVTQAKGVFYPQDFDYLIDYRGGVLNSTRVGQLVTAYRKGGDLVVQLAQIDPKGCAGQIVTDCNNEAGLCNTYCAGDDYTQFNVLAEYAFHGCQ